MPNKTEWAYCPECGCEELHHEQGEHKQCANCYQEWFSSVDYSDVVQKHLSGKYIDKDEQIERLRQDLELTRLARQGDQIEIDGLKALCDRFRAQLADAAQSLETISRLAGRDEFMEDMTDVRGYANSRASVARGALSAIAEQKCETCHDQGEVFVSKGKVEYGMLTEPEPIYKPCPDCAEPANKESAQ